MDDTNDETPLTPSELPIARNYGLGRKVSADLRDKKFAMRRVLPTRAPRPRLTPYSLGPTLDQGETSQCVGYSLRHKLTAAPIMVTASRGLSAFEIYKGAQMNDEWPGDEYDGSSVRGGFKFLASRGYIKSYVWAETVQEIHKFLHDGWGSVVVGTDWYGSMFDPDASGFVRPSFTDRDLAGGHAYHLFWTVLYDAAGNKLQPGSTAADLTRSEAWFQNSWGEHWGIKLNGRYGCFKMRLSDVQQLIDNSGEAGAGIEVRVA